MNQSRDNTTKEVCNHKSHLQPNPHCNNELNKLSIKLVFLRLPFINHQIFY
jgi:hypothetical protein